MSAPNAFRATYSDLKLIKTRQCVQIVFELPLADFDAAYGVLGGMPNPANETWFGICPLQQPKEEKVESRPVSAPKPQPDGDRRSWADMQPAQQAGIRANDPVFIAYLKEERADEWHETGDAAECIRLICGVSSRVELGTNHAKRVLWHQLDSGFEAWKLAEQVGA